MHFMMYHSSFIEEIVTEAIYNKTEAKPVLD